VVAEPTDSKGKDTASENVNVSDVAVMQSNPTTLPRRHTVYPVSEKWVNKIRKGEYVDLHSLLHDVKGATKWPKGQGVLLSVDDSAQVCVPVKPTERGQFTSLLVTGLDPLRYHCHYGKSNAGS
jgi:hypothetical protein